MRTEIILTVLAVAVAGCQTSGSTSDDGVTQPALSSAAASAIAGDMSARLAELVPPKDISLQLTPDHTQFGVALEAALKGWGYAVNPGEPTDKVAKLDFATDQSGEDVLASVAVPSVVLSRSYLASGTGAVPRSPLSVLRRE